MPEEALAGATLVVTRNRHDDRRDDVARIDLGIRPEEVPRLWNTSAAVEVSPARMADS
ncbi:Uncharacterised protein [Mycolicibacterium phlei]|uniref:Uncharacterized protein n=1 Tax=Mycolicibacterium phlei DSM 43239 = CCUG 21000 TaxID=1226750 RepID=A0A5N5UST8_MYCPH|nr:hypothetical protein [Mycolicibacterium phlei]VEG09429.1 Uncharacterised protein [Mycobacteroides chelonae]AMO61315.1 hypothetical protein MPHLCCUG_02503 [Mycolicibacterium phlei]KAB7752662.1 hypothetical protein MPHL21000_20980 [Mycolicibacterium phlei DSM 43239 = CCUG 21000]KXW61015.1 hypothetical protein MPHL43239_22755 [Mycolicibacterium phlei DSM 43239 = CCUG 21000]KXW62982.1 hypothetical protein MPHL43072_08595 [Mycolicibacterium phlei DSM 43072]